MATGFLFFIPVRQLPNGTTGFRCYLVTNRHVLDGPHAIVLRFNPASAGQPPADIDLELRDQLGLIWAAHPDANVDMAAMGLDVNLLEARGLRFGYLTPDSALTIEAMIAEEVSEGDGVYLVGFPMGLNTPAMQYAIVRSGCIARVRDAYDAKRGPFLIDASVFPGNSGGPVLLRPEATALQGTRPHMASKLIGVVHAYLPYTDAAISQQTGRPRVIFEENSGLARVETVDGILEACSAAQDAWDRRFPPAAGESAGTGAADSAPSAEGTVSATAPQDSPPAGSSHAPDGAKK